MSVPSPAPPENARRTAYAFILLMGLVSLLGDVAYEGARSVTGPYLAGLGAGAAAVGFVAGLGNFLGYGLRILSGFAVDRSGRHWAVAILGYSAIFCIPLLALADSWQMAVLLLLGERVGKALRSPARDAILSHVARPVGRGWGFGLHEAMDQLGAFVGPMVFTLVFLLGGGYRQAFAVLAVPCVLMVACLLVARGRVPDPAAMEAAHDPRPAAPSPKGLPRVFWAYSAFSFLTAAGLAGFPLIAFRLKEKGLAGDELIPVLYALAMAADGVAALAAGRLFDRLGVRFLLLTPLLTAPAIALSFLGGLAMAAAGIVLWGVVMGIHETVMRAAIAEITPTGSRGAAYGLYNTVYGLALFAGTSVMGVLYARSALWTVAFAAACELAALPAFLFFLRRARSQPA